MLLPERECAPNGRLRDEGYGDHLNESIPGRTFGGDVSGWKGEENDNEVTRLGGAMVDDEGEAARSRRVLAAVRVLKGRRALCAFVNMTSEDAPDALEAVPIDDWLNVRGSVSYGYWSVSSPRTRVAGELMSERVILPVNGAKKDASSALS